MMIFSFLVAVILVYAFGIITFPYADTFFYSSGDTRLVVSGATNAFHYWSLDPLFSFVSKVAPPLTFPLMGGVLSSGAYFWLKKYADSESSAWVLAIGLVSALFGLFGFDATLIGALVWAPWCFAAMDRVILAELPKATSFIPFVVFSYLLSHAAHELMLPIIGIYFTATLFRVEDKKLLPLGVLGAVALFFSLKEIWLFSAPPFPSYPPFSRVHLAVSPHLDPSVGPHLPFPILDRESLFPILLILGGPITLLGIVSFFKGNAERWCSVLTLTLGFSLIWDSLHLFPEAGGEIGPISALSRMVPGLSFHSLGSTIGGLSLLFLPFHFLTRNRSRIFFSFGVILLGIALLSKKPIGLSSSGVSALQMMRSSPEAFTLGNSPSFSLLKMEGERIFQIRERIKGVSRRKLSRFPHVLDASHNPEDLKGINSEALGKRWTSGGGMQRGDEWIHIKLESPIDLGGIKITTGWFSGDFPRGVKILAASTCDGDESRNFESYEEVLTAEPWRGGVVFTEDGYPYIEPRHLGTFLFPSTKTVNCLLIKQTGLEAKLDWSVSEIYLLISKK